MEGVHRGVKQFSSIDDAEKDLIRYSLVTDSTSNSVSQFEFLFSNLSSNERGEKGKREIRANFIPERIDIEMNKFYIIRARLF